MTDRAQALVNQSGATTTQRGLVQFFVGGIRMHQRRFDQAHEDLTAAEEAIGANSPDHEYLHSCVTTQAQVLHLLGRNAEAVACSDRAQQAFPWLPPSARAYDEVVSAVARAVVGGPAREQERLIEFLGPEVTYRTPNLSIWLAGFGCLADLAGDHAAARDLLDPGVFWPNLLGPLCWEHLRRASHWSEAELRDHQQPTLISRMTSDRSKWAELLRAEVARLTTS
jgi:hypothetical protein